MRTAEVAESIKYANARLGMASQAAMELMLGNCAVESNMGQYRKQLGGGPARGIFQMEPSTYYWLLNIYAPRFPWLWHHCDALIYDDILAAAMCRLRYRIVEAPLPPAGDLWAQAKYWKKWYNTEKGAGTVQKYIQKYREYVA